MKAAYKRVELLVVYIVVAIATASVIQFAILESLEEIQKVVVASTSGF